MRLQSSLMSSSVQTTTHITAFQNQEIVRQREYNLGLFTEAMARLPGLEQVKSNFANEIMEQMAASRRSSPLTNEWNREKEDQSPHSGMQLRSILVSAHDADTKLKALRCGRTNWKFFQLPEADFDAKKSALNHLTHIEISIGDSMDASEFTRF